MTKLLTRLLIGAMLMLLSLIPYISGAQYFVVGQDPAFIKWRQINTKNFQIIYPSDYEIEANRVAHIFETVYLHSGVTLKHQPRKISILLHTKSIQSNGFVAWSPSRVELFPTPGQENYAQEWMEQLAIHELRHHVQIDKIQAELPKIFRILLGEQAASIVIGAYLPFWFLEGDAVVTETAFSRSGRGRLPAFSMELKALVDEKGIFSFDKAYLGSYKDYIPDYYQLGYQMVSNVRNQNRAEVWGDVLHHSAKHPLGLNSLSKGLKNSTGKTQDEYYTSIMKNLRETSPFRFNNQVDTTEETSSLVEKSKYYTSCRYPYFVNDSTVVALKTGIDQISSIVAIDHLKREKIIYTPGLVLDESLSVANSEIIWIESKPDLRWTHKERSLLRILNLDSGGLWEKVYEEKLFAPVISPDGKQIAAVKFDHQNKCSIILINKDNGLIVKAYNAVEYDEFFTPSWSSDQKNLFAVALDGKGKSIIRITLDSGKLEKLTKSVFGEIKKPIQRADYLYYSSDLAGKNEGYALDLTTKKNYRILTAKYGIRDLQSTSKGNSLLFANYTANGFKLARKESNRTTWQLMDENQRFQDTLSNKLTAQEKGVIDFSHQDTSKFLSSKYLKIKNLLNIHSWSPLYIDPDQSVVNTGFSIVSQNKLATTITQFGYNYSTVNQSGKWIGKFEYAGWYPVLRLYGDYGREYSRYYQINRHYNSKNVLIGQDTVAVPFFRKVMNFHFDATLPLNFSKGKMYRMIEPEIQIGYSHYWKEPSTPSAIFSGSYIPFTYRVYAHNLRQQSTRDIQTKWGQIINLQYRNTPLGDRNLGNIGSAEGTLYFPGLFNSHGLRFYGGYQIKNSDNSYFGDLIAYPRGYMDMENNRLFTLRSDYVLPLVTPDWNILHLYYLKRVSLRLHYDFAQISSPIVQIYSTLHQKLSSTGGELLTECHFFRFLAPVKMGFRESYLIESRMLTSEFIFSISFSGL